MNAERSPNAVVRQFARVFAYRPNAITPFALACAVVFVVMCFFIFVFAHWEGLDARTFFLLTLPMALMGAWTAYLWIVAKTATLVVTEHGIVYSDRWVRRALLWTEISKVTPFAIRSKKGKGIALKLGIKGLENWQELINITRELSDAQILV